jgi:hypothetical protein
MSSVNKIHRVKLVECPVCGSALNAAKSVNGADQPREYDLSVCGFCTTVLIFDKDIKARVITDIEFEILKSVNPELYTQINTVIKTIENRRGKPVGQFD